MKQRIKARELWLFAPFLLFGVAALLYWRWEQVTPKDKRGFYVSKIERRPATARDESNHISHHVTVTLSHSWPRPLWWGEIPQEPYLLDPLQPSKPATPYYGPQSDKSFASGGLPTGVRGGKEVNVGSLGTLPPGIMSFDGKNYKVEHGLSLREASQGAGDVVFKGLYRFKNSDLVRAQKVVRAKGEQFPPIDKKSGLRIVAVRFSPWKKRTELQMNNKMGKSDILVVKIIVEHTPPLTSGAAKPKIKGQVDSVEDERRSNFSRITGIPFLDDVPAGELKPNQSGKSFHYWLDEKEKTEGRLVIKGELWRGDRWPLSFEFKLPPRLAATAPAK